MDWNEVKAALSDGFGAARRFSEHSLGMDLSDYEHGIVGIEYVATVEVAEKLVGWDRSVYIEKHFKDLRASVAAARRHNAMMSGFVRSSDQRKILAEQQAKELLEIRKISAQYRFGCKDSKRIDIAVFDGDRKLPKVAVEIKIYNGSLVGFEEDVSRVSELVQMFADFAAPGFENFFGVASIYVQEVGKDKDSIVADKFDGKIKSIINTISMDYPSVSLELCEICVGEEPIRVTEPTEEEEGELLRDKMGYRGVAVVARRRQPETVAE